MIPKSGYRFSDQIMLKQKHDPEKWIAVSRLHVDLILIEV
jgi:hypothetical protein